MPSQTIVVSIIVAILAIAFLYLRSKKEEKSAHEAAQKMRRNTSDALMGSNRKKTFLADSDSQDLDEVVQEPTEPSFEPPIYSVLEKEEQAKEEEEKARIEEEATRKHVRANPMVDGSIELILDIYPSEGNQFSLGGVKSLYNELLGLHLPLPITVWARSSKDKLYYEAHELTSPASHVVASMVLANRTFILDEVVASRFYQALEQSAAQNDVRVRGNYELGEAVKRAQILSRVIKYYDSKCEVLFDPRDPDEEFGLDRIDSFAKSMGFEASSGCWTYKANPTDSEPVFYLQYAANGTRSLSLKADIPLLIPARGDIKKFFMLSNHIANTLHCIWCDSFKAPMNSQKALAIDAYIERTLSKMASSGVEAGSRRQEIIFGHTGKQKEI